MKYTCALITVADIKRSCYFYENLLQQKVQFDFGENVAFEGGFAIHLDTHYKLLIDNKEIRQGGNNFELYFEHDNVDEIANLLKEKKVSFVHEVREQPWRQKVMRFYDPDNHIIEVGESMEYLAYRLKNEGLSIEKIAETTMMPVEFVLHAIEKYELINKGVNQDYENRTNNNY